MTGSPLEARVEPLPGALPSFAWRWDQETEILSGAFKGTRKHAGLTGSVELTSPDGAVVVLDVANGLVCGLDIVIWPPVVEARHLAAPTRADEGRVVLPLPGSRADVALLQAETVVAARVNPGKRVMHLAVGEGEPAAVVRVAERLLAELDADGAIAGFWLLDVPAWPAPDPDPPPE